MDLATIAAVSGTSLGIAGKIVLQGIEQHHDTRTMEDSNMGNNACKVQNASSVRKSVTCLVIVEPRLRAMRPPRLGSAGMMAAHARMNPSAMNNTLLSSNLRGWELK